MKADARKEVDIFRKMKGGLTGAAGLSSRHHQRNLCIVGLEQQLVSPEFIKKRQLMKLELLWPEVPVLFFFKFKLCKTIVPKY